MIVSRLNGLALAVDAANKNPGARVIPWNKIRANHFWWYEDYRYGMIRSKLNDFCLEAQGILLSHSSQDKTEPVCTTR